MNPTIANIHSSQHVADHDGGAPLISVNEQIVHLDDCTPTGNQILLAAGLHPTADYALLQLTLDKALEAIRPDEVCKLGALQTNRFFAWNTDRLYYFELNERKYPWSGKIAESFLRELGGIPDTDEIWLERREESDVKIESGGLVDLTVPGVERLYSRAKSWKLDVQGVKIDSPNPTIMVRDALKEAGINPDQGWIIILKVAGQPKKQLELDSAVDLTTPGIERLRLTPKQINNGEIVSSTRREFQLLPKDEAYLNSLGLHWETVSDGRRWLIIYGYGLPTGFSGAVVDLAIEMPLAYPAAEIDMFYCYPLAMLSDGRVPPQTDHQESVCGRQFQRWSRHRPPGTWSAEYDSIITHLALVDESLLREVGQ